MNSNPRYLGDSVYASIKNGKLKLSLDDSQPTTSHGQLEPEKPVIYLEDYVYQALVLYVIEQRGRGNLDWNK